MHRMERIELDLPDGNLPSLSQRFSAKTGHEPAELLGSARPDQNVDPRTAFLSATRSDGDAP
jgi:hypothetical protein